MKKIRNRATQSFPAALLTLLSIVQAVALETLWEQTLQQPEIFQLSRAALVVWLQVAICLHLLILIWLAYVGLAMRFRITPRLADLICPFYLGLAEFLLIEMMGPAHLGVWFLVLALILIMQVVFSQWLFRRARLDPANKQFFGRLKPATWRDFRMAGIFISGSILLGVWLLQHDVAGWVALSALLVTLVGLIYQIRIAARFWGISMGELEIAEQVTVESREELR